MGEMQSARPVEAMRPNIWPKVDLSSVRHRRDNDNHTAKTGNSRQDAREIFAL
jgi:hypothetical protein